MTSLLGGSLGALYATNLGGARPFGYEGWRFAFFSVAMLSIIIGAFRSLALASSRRVCSAWSCFDSNSASSAGQPCDCQPQHWSTAPRMVACSCALNAGSAP